MMQGFRFGRKSVGLLLCVAALSATTSFAQNYSTMSLQDIVAGAQALLQRGEHSAAIAALEEAVKRTEKLSDPAKVEICQNCRFQLARCHFQLGDIATAMPILEEYIDNSPRKQERMALRMMAQGLFDTKNWERIEQVAGRLLSMTDLSMDDRLNANLMLGQSLFQQGKWKECIEPLTYTANKTKDDNTRQVTQIMIVRALVERAEEDNEDKEAWGELFSWVPRVYRTDAKYDITLNLTVMQAGKARFKQDDSLNALLLYRMVLPREKLIEHAEGRIDEMEKQLAADAAAITEYERTSRNNEIESLRALVEQIQELAPYEDEVAFRIGQIYREIKRYWEGYVLFDALYSKNENSTDDAEKELGDAAIFELVVTLYEMKETDRAEARIIKYLDEHLKGQNSRVFLSLMMRDNLSKEGIEYVEKVLGLRKYVDRLSNPKDSDDQMLQADLHYMMAFAYFQSKDYVEAGNQFSEIIDRYPKSNNAADSSYYRGMTYMMQGTQETYQSAIDDFTTYQTNYEDGMHYAATKFRQSVCLFGQNKVKEAEAAFTAFIEAYPDNEFVSEAYSMRGDIEAAKDGQDDPNTPDVDEYDPYTLDRALADYRKAIDLSVNPLQASYAAFAAAKVYKLEFRWQEIIDLMDDYLDKKGSEADVAEAIFWKGKAMIALDQFDEAVVAYVDAILRFGNSVAKEGVDKIITELVQIADMRLSPEEREDLLLRVKLKLDAVDEEEKTLELRLKMTRAYLAGQEVLDSLGKRMLEEEQDLTVVPPLGLALMCDAAVDTGNVEKMNELFDFFIDNFEDSENSWAAYRAKAHALIAAGERKATLDILEEALSAYGADTFMGWAQILKGDTLYGMQLYKEADEAYNVVTSVAAWRGPLYAQAMIGIARCHKANGNLKEAHTFFQRTYMLYKAYDNGKWAADAYLAAGEVLIEDGKQMEAVNTWKAMLENDYVNTLPQAQTAKELIKKYGDA